MEAPSIFDVMASNYDNDFSKSLVGMVQRNTIHDFFKLQMAGKSGLEILELNCGTGEDISFLQTFGNVTATDASEEMVKIAAIKNPGVECFVLDFNKPLQIQKKYDVIFSNFGGLNCIKPSRLKDLSVELKHLLRPDGQLFLVFMHNKSVMEFLYFSIKLNFGKAIRRMKGNATFGELEIYYYSKREVRNIFQPYQFNTSVPIGLILSGEYMNKIGNVFRKWDSRVGWLEPILGADHMLFNFTNRVT
jgi:SAM-dependent methyltransferase